jgi:hypothetical protein
MFASALGAEGSGARPPRHPRILLVLVASAVLGALVLGVTLASAAAPTATIEPASAVRYTTAHVEGHVAPAGSAVFWRFQYATQTQFEAGEWEGAGISGSIEESAGTTTVEGTVEGLKPGTNYHVRLLAENETTGETAEAVAPAFTTEVVAAPSVSLEPVTTVGATDVLFVGHVNPNAPHAQGSTDAAEEAAFRTEYRFVCSPACPGLTGATGTIEADDTNHEVTAESTALPAGSRSYEVKLVAANAGGTTVAGPIPFTTTSAAPTIESTSASPGVREIEFRASIDPGNLATTYRFEYGPTAAYGRSTEAQTIPPASSPVAVAATVAGLEPSSTYHFRLVTQNSKGPGVGVDQVVTTGSEVAPQSCPNEQLRSENHSLALPNCRAYEMVSPPFKNGQPPIAFEGVAESGSALAYNSLGAFGEPGNDSEQIGGAYVANRESAGWSSTPVNPSATEFNGESPNLQTGEAAETVDYNSTLTASLFFQAPRASKPIDSRFYIRTLNGDITEVGPALSRETIEAWTPADAEEDLIPATGYAGASGDFSHVFFVAKTASRPDWLWPGDETARIEAPSLYEYSGTRNSEPELVGVENHVPLTQAAREAGDSHINEAAQLIGQCGVTLGGTTTREAISAQNAISSSGDTVYFTVLPQSRECASPLNGPPVTEVYVRKSRTETTAISEPTTGPGGDCETCDTTGPMPALFEAAGEDGEQAYFLSRQALLPGASGNNLYEYDFEAPAHDKLTLVAPELPTGEPGSNEELRGFVQASANGKVVYFVSEDPSLASNRDARGRTAREEQEAGEEPQFLYGFDSSGDLTTFVAPLSREDEQDWKAANTRPVSVTPSGSFLLFPSVNDLTPGASGPARQLYRFDMKSNELVRISVGAEGFNDDGNAAAPPGSLFSPEYHPGLIELGAERFALAAPKPVLITDNGSQVFFDSPLALTPAALDDACAYENFFGECEAPALNVYEWQGGRVSLISDGRDAASRFRFSATELIGATPSGKDVLFTTADKLAPADTDTQVDVYDAHEDGGFAAAPESSGCQGEACQGATARPPEIPLATSSSLAGLTTHKARKKHKSKRHRKKHARHLNSRSRRSHKNKKGRK